MSTSKECKAVRNCILNELHLTKEDIIKNIEPLLEKHVKRYMVNTYGGDNQIENWIRCMVNDELKRRDHDFVRKACESVIRDHVLNELNIIVRSKSEKCTCENRVPSEEDKKESTDGLYIIYKDGHAEPFTGDNSKDCVRYIGLKHRYMSFAISLTEHDIVQLLDDDSREESGSGTYYERECDALFDIDGRGNTERLVARNPKLRNLLEDGEYIPSLGQLNLMAHYMDELNKAFTYVSASPLSSTWYWSSTESSQGPFLSIRIRGKDEIIPFKDKKEIQSVKAHLCSVFSGFVKIGDWYLKMSEVKEYKPVTAEDMNPYILFKTSKFGNIKVRFPKDEDMDAELLVLDQLFDVE